MKKIFITGSTKEFEEFVNRSDISILSIDVKAVEQSYSFQQNFCAVVYYDDDITGATKRELFASMAMQGLLASGEHRYGGIISNHADYAVKCADALIEELNKE